jgi:hypothetical protein
VEACQQPASQAVVEDPSRGVWNGVNSPAATAPMVTGPMMRRGAVPIRWRSAGRRFHGLSWPRPAAAVDNGKQLRAVRRAGGTLQDIIAGAVKASDNALAVVSEPYEVERRRASISPRRAARRWGWEEKGSRCAMWGRSYTGPSIESRLALPRRAPWPSIRGGGGGARAGGI